MDKPEKHYIRSNKSKKASYFMIVLIDPPEKAAPEQETRGCSWGLATMLLIGLEFLSAVMKMNVVISAEQSILHPIAF